MIPKAYFPLLACLSDLVPTASSFFRTLGLCCLLSISGTGQLPLPLGPSPMYSLCSEWSPSNSSGHFFLIQFSGQMLFPQTCLPWPPHIAYSVYFLIALLTVRSKSVRVCVCVCNLLSPLPLECKLYEGRDLEPQSKSSVCYRAGVLYSVFARSFFWYVFCIFLLLNFPCSLCTCIVLTNRWIFFSLNFIKFHLISLNSYVLAVWTVLGV